MRITYDFYQRCTKLPWPTSSTAEATGLKVHLFGEKLERHGQGPRHRARRARGPAWQGASHAVDPLFLDEMKAKPDQSYSVKLGDKTFTLSLADIIYDTPKGDFPRTPTL